MVITKEKRELIAKTQRVTDAIVKKLVDERKKEKKVDLVNLTKNLVDRKIQASKDRESNEEE